MDDKIRFSLPGLYLFSHLNRYLIELMEKYPDQFNDDVVIDSVYGCFPCIWDGGRSSSGNGSFAPEDLKNAIEFLNKRNIKVRYTFSNLLIDDCNIKDTVGNTILELTEKYQLIQNGIILASDCMRKYIQEKYPDFEVTWSTTLGIKDKEEIDKYTKNDILVPYYGVNNNFELLKTLSYPENIEIMVNEECIENCPRRAYHYKLNSMVSMKQDVQPFRCENVNWNLYSTVKKRKHFVSIENIKENYLPLGINRFKIVGRQTSILKTIEAYVDFLVKPEYKDDIRFKLFSYVAYNERWDNA